MLYDKRWDKPEVKADPFSLDSLIAWLEKQPTEKKYCFLDNGGCLLFQYLTAAGINVEGVGGFTYHDDSGPHLLSDEFRSVARGHPRTFGSALNRARRFPARWPQVTGA